jgi:hypothetical protein
MSCEKGYHRTAIAVAPSLGAANGGAAVPTKKGVRGGAGIPPSPMFSTLSRHGRITAVSVDKRGYTRCSNCGQFASRTKPHICPMTTNPRQLGKTLFRRLRVPFSAYGGEGLDTLLRQARADGTIDMRHGLTNEHVAVTLDGLSVALASGYVPQVWIANGQYPTMAMTDSGRVVAILDPSARGLRTLDGTETSAMASTAAAYGAELPPNATIANVVTTPADNEDRPLVPPMDGESTTVSGGHPYDMGHFAGTEYQKHGHHGTPIEAYGELYTGGQRSQDLVDWGSARVKRIVPPPQGGVAVGRTLVPAVDLLGRGSMVETPAGVIELYDERGGLLSAYDPRTHTAGDVAGNPNASPQQMAALMAYHLTHPRTELDKALVGDYADMLAGRSKTPLAVADSAYLVMQHDVLARNGTVNLGGQMQTQHCPYCGQFIGTAPHTCPAQDSVLSGTPVGTASTLEKGAAIADAMSNQQAGIMPQGINVVVGSIAAEMDANALGAKIADGLKDAQTNVDVSAVAELDSNQLGSAIAAGMASYMAEQQGQQVDSVKALADAITSASPESNQQMVEAINNLIAAKVGASADGNGAVQAVQGSTPEWVDSLVGALDRLQPAGAGVASRAKAQEDEAPIAFERTANRLPESVDEMTAQEFIMSSITVKEPDPLLSGVPAEVGGQLRSAIRENIPAVDPNYFMNEDAEITMRTVSAMVQQGMHLQDDPRSGWTKSFLLYGPAGTGKNKTAEQIAATIRTVDGEGKVKQGIGYYETTFTAETNMDTLVGSPVLEPDPATGATRSRLNIGPLAAAAACGSVIALNEIVNCDPKKVAVLQDMIEKRQITLESPEGGKPVVIPVHPSTLFVGTMNAGYEGGRDRPGLAMLSRMTPIRMDRPSKQEMAQRIEGFFASMEGGDESTDAVSQRRQEIVQNDYQVPRLDPKKRPKMIAAAAELNEQISMLARRSSGIGGEIGQMSDTPPEVGPREAVRFAALANAVGPWRASRIYDIYCDQSSDMFPEQRALIDERVEAIFGARDLEVDAVTRMEQGGAPVQS